MLLAVGVPAVIFVLALAALVKGADWFLESAEKIGKAFGLSAFLIGVLIIGLGTSLPELVSSIFGVLGGVPEVVAANAVGSNITNILLIIGAAAIVGRKIVITKNLLDLEIPILLTSTVMFLVIIFDGSVTIIESILLLLSYVVYLLYTIFHKDSPRGNSGKAANKKVAKKDRIRFMDIFWLIVGVTFLAGGANFLIDSVKDIATVLNISPAIITITAVALGTSLPELIVSVKAALNGKSELAVGNIFGSNAFNALVVVGLPGLLGTLPVDQGTLLIGLPFMAMATLMFIISCMSHRIYLWEGALYMIVYVLFIGKLLALF